MLAVRKNVTRAVVLLSVLSFSAGAFAVGEDDAVKFNVVPPQINAVTYVLMDYHTGQILAEKEANQRHYPASLTKMMTSYVIGQALKQGRIRRSDMVTITEESWGKNFPDSSKMFLNLNDQVSVADLNRGIIIDSGNDACVAMANYIAGTQQNFIKLMNQYVVKFGLKNTHFATVHGLDNPDQYSSAYDMAVIGAHLIRDLPEEYEIYKELDFTYNNIKQYNRNGLLKDKTLHVDGIKTGHTDEAGYNLVASAVDGDTRLISVVMGVGTYKGREVESKKLLQWGFNNFETVKVMPAGNVVSESKVYYGDKGEVKLGTLEDAYATIPRHSLQKLKASYVMNTANLEAPLSKGQVVGKVTYSLDGKEVAQVNLQVMEPVEEAGFFGKIIDWVVLTVKSLF